MRTIDLQSEQNELIRMILDVHDMNLLTKIKEMLSNREGATTEMTKSEIVNHITQSCREAKQIKEGKLKGISAEELLNEL